MVYCKTHRSVPCWDLFCGKWQSIQKLTTGQCAKNKNLKSLVHHTPFSQILGIYMQERTERLWGPMVVCDFKETSFSRYNRPGAHINKYSTTVTVHTKLV